MKEAKTTSITPTTRTTRTKKINSQTGLHPFCTILERDSFGALGILFFRYWKDWMDAELRIYAFPLPSKFWDPQNGLAWGPRLAQNSFLRSISCLLVPTAKLHRRVFPGLFLSPESRSAPPRAGFSTNMENDIRNFLFHFRAIYFLCVFINHEITISLVIRFHRS
ncbi:hypothetical protein RvY_10112-2 [Ramazzottius varieornatus]|uniref:Uncharacterized protein n=1 Tax=Ramazzottius varieornatus TaxID=947166 RepID=A0A1D1VBP6_RAMVA|nr:hypothetical protein RvY_10112-2 [Ramazzottius varieornatus]